MTLEPAAPNADAICLYREDSTDNKLHMEAVYVRMNILRDEGKKYADDGQNPPIPWNAR